MTKEDEFEINWEIFSLTGLAWSEVKGLDSDDKERMYEKALDAKKRFLEQERARMIKDHNNIN